MKQLLLKLMPMIDIVLIPFVFCAAWILKLVRMAKVQRLPLCRRVLRQVGVFPIQNHYYEPQFDYREIRQPFSQDRTLPGIDWDIAGQLKTLSTFTFTQELLDIPQDKPETLDFYLKNGSFETGDAEFLYQLIRVVKPKRIIEIGSGNSTLMAFKAIEKNRQQDPGYSCDLTCIEPYEKPWLEQKGLNVIRRKVEDLNMNIFSSLEENDILFIDSSHIIRPQGDVLFECLEILPTLKKGVIVHIHDIFSPKNYKEQWLLEEVRMWNEQYLVEAFLSNNCEWKILGAVNHLRHHYMEQLKAIAPFLTSESEPSSFYIKKMV